MKFVCLGYSEEAKWDNWSEAERNAFVEECLAYDQELKDGGHMIGGHALQSSRNAATLRYRSGQVTVTDGPYAETKEQLGGLMLLEARDMNHAIQLMSKHPGVRMGAFEIRPADAEFEQIIDSKLS